MTRRAVLPRRRGDGLQHAGRRGNEVCVLEDKNKTPVPGREPTPARARPSAWPPVNNRPADGAASLPRLSRLVAQPSRGAHRSEGRSAAQRSTGRTTNNFQLGQQRGRATPRHATHRGMHLNNIPRRDRVQECRTSLTASSACPRACARARESRDRFNSSAGLIRLRRSACRGVVDLAHARFVRRAAVMGHEWDVCGSAVSAAVSSSSPACTRTRRAACASALSGTRAFVRDAVDRCSLRTPLALRIEPPFYCMLCENQCPYAFAPRASRA